MNQQIEKDEPDALVCAVWFGKGAAVVGLFGAVHQADFKKFLDGVKELRG